MFLRQCCIKFVEMNTIRKTRAVNTLLCLFEQSAEAMSVVDLADCLKEEMNKTTVYRILDRLEQHNIVHSFMGKDGLKWYAKCEEENVVSRGIHPHFQCSYCGKVKCLPVDIEVPSIQNHNVESAEILLVGCCDACLS